MELTGDLNDFALTDILQILSLSRKTGTLSIESGGLTGKVVIEYGRIIYASIVPGETLAERLIRENQFNPHVLGDLRVIGCSDEGMWTLESLIVESGLMSGDDLKLIVKQHIQGVVGKLVALERGRFGISLNESEICGSLYDVAFNEGLDVSETLLGAAKESDEGGEQVEKVIRGIQNSSNEVYASLGVIGDFAQKVTVPSDNYKPDNKKIIRNGSSNNKENIDNGRTSLLCSLLTELRSYSFEAEVILVIMRYASEVASRGILFVVRNDDICGLGQFGVNSKKDKVSADECVREIRVVLDKSNILGEVALSGIPYIGTVPDIEKHENILNPIGGTDGRESMFALPVVCQGRSIFIIYGDNYPSIVDFSGVDGLLALVNQAGIILEKIVLERLLDEVRLGMDVGIKISDV